MRFLPLGRRAAGLVMMLLAGAGLGPAAAAAQQAAQQPAALLSGRVVDASTGAPVVNAQVHVLGTRRAALTGTDGGFRIAQLLPGSYVVQARALGFRSASQTVTVADLAREDLTFSLAVSAVPLDEVVVTGQADEVARREIGNALATIDAEALGDRPIFNTAQLLQSRAPGVEVLPGGGKVGQGSRVFLRGLTSMTQDVQPIIYVDGVRIDASFVPGIDTGGPTWGGLDDLHPDDIERIEIVRGASAATLYGTEASAGVIQIFTKRGRGGAQQFNLSSEIGLASSPQGWWDVSPHAGWFHDAFVGQGVQQRHHVSVRGVVDQFTYYASGGYRTEDGILASNSLMQRTFRANMRVVPRQNLALQGNVAFGQREIQLPFDGASRYGLGRHGLVGGPSGIPTLEQDDFDVMQIPSLEMFLNSTRFTAGGTVEFLPMTNFLHRFTLGADIFNSDNTELHEFGSVFEADGIKENYRRQAQTYSAHYTARFQHDFSPTLSSATSFGFQAYSREDSYNLARGERFVGPGLFTVAVTGLTRGDEDRFTRRHAGFYLEEQLGFNDVLFVTVGGRYDGHSAFGPGNRYRFYPKAAASYVLSDHLSLPEAVSSFRLRAAYGEAGQQPQDYVATRTWRPVPSVALIGVTTGNPGNPDLAPEVSREIEAGFDAGLMGDRLGMEFTVYSQRTRDALLPVQYAPSTGWPEPRWENRGELSNVGVEATVRATPVRTGALDWGVNASFFTNRNRVESTGGLPPMHYFGAQWIQEGYPVAGFFADREVVTPEGIERVRGAFIGPAFPTRSVQLGTDLRLRQGVRLNGLLDHRGGHFLESNTLRALALGTDPTAHIENRGDFVRSGDFWRLRELSLGYDVPAGVADRLPATSATLTVAGRNLWRSQTYTGLEAEAHFNPLVAIGRQTAFDTPLPRQVVVGVSLGF